MIWWCENKNDPFHLKRSEARRCLSEELELIEHMKLDFKHEGMNVIMSVKT